MYIKHKLKIYSVTFQDSCIVCLFLCHRYNIPGWNSPVFFLDLDESLGHNQQKTQTQPVH